MKKVLCYLLIGLFCFGGIIQVYAQESKEIEPIDGEIIEEHYNNDINNILLLDDNFILFLQEIKEMNPDLSAEELLELVEDSYKDEMMTTSSISYPSGWSALTNSEKLFLIIHPTLVHPIQLAVNDANAFTIQYYGWSRIGDQSDAYRHAVWNALMAKYIAASSSPEYGISRAQAFATAHEDIPDSQLSQPSYNSFGQLDGYTYYSHKEMDLLNNQKGRDIYNVNRTLTSTALAQTVYQNRSNFIFLYWY